MKVALILGALLLIAPEVFAGSYWFLADTQTSRDAAPERAVTPVTDPETDVVRLVLQLQRAIPVPHQIESFTTPEGRSYHNPVVIRVEPDGIHLRHNGGVSKFTIAELSSEIRERYHLFPAVSVAYIAEMQSARARRAAQLQAAKDRRRAEHQEQLALIRGLHLKEGQHVQSQLDHLSAWAQGQHAMRAQRIAMTRTPGALQGRRSRHVIIYQDYPRHATR